MKISLRTPMVPKFVLADLAGKDVTLSLGDVPEDELRELAERWTRALLDKAARQRNLPNETGK